MTAFTTVILSLSVVLTGGAIAHPVMAQTPPLEQQLNMRLTQFERARELQKAERFAALAEREMAWGRYDEAIAAWQTVLDIYSSLNDQPGIQQTFEPLIKALISARSYDDAETVIQQQLTWAQTHSDPVMQMYALNNLGVVYLQTGQLDRGIATITTALVIAENLVDPGGIGLALSNLGLAARLAGDLDSAQNYYESAIAYRSQAGDLIGLANSGNSLGAIYRQFSDDEAALQAYLYARESAQSANHIPTLLVALDGLIGIYADLGEVDALEVYLPERTAATPKLAPSEQQLDLYIGLGRYHALLEDYPRARAAYDRALMIAEEVGAAAKRTFILNQLEGLTLLVETL